MKESLLYLIWQQQLLNLKTLYTTQGEIVIIYKPGVLNRSKTLGFDNALMEIGGQKWAGNVRVCLKSSVRPQFHKSNVILYVVYEFDTEPVDLQHHQVPILELKHYVPSNILLNYDKLMAPNHNFIFCEKHFKNIDAFKKEHWLERLYVERLERKVKDVEKVYKMCGQDWEATLFLTMAKYFGGNVNGHFFLEAFAQVDYAIIRKQFVNKTANALFFGLVGLLESKDVYDDCYQSLKKEFEYQKQKHQLKNLTLPKLRFYGCRPQNFPTIRLAQLVAFYEKHQSAFAKILSLGKNINRDQDFFKITIDAYWQTHYHFNKPSKESSKQISKSFVALLLMNVIVPVLFLYHQKRGEVYDDLLALMYQIAPEKNGIVTKFNQIGDKAKSALQTQALLTLKKEYCEKERCTECEIGINCIKT